MRCFRSTFSGIFGVVSITLLQNLRCKTLTSFRFYKDVFLCRVMELLECNSTHWKSKFIDELPSLFAERVRKILKGEGVSIKYDDYTYGNLISACVQEGISLCNEIKLNQQIKRHHWGISSMIERQFSLNKVSMKFTYWDYIQAFNKVLHYNNERHKHTWFIKVCAQIFANPIPNWWSYHGPTIKILSDPFLKIYREWVKNFMFPGFINGLQKWISLKNKSPDYIELITTILGIN
ncbi:hypothetical protein H5410_051352 [Solanum commersonii]|uniref:Uncharacterized protein n=1 Tax=Solanum commersonii TaxID=4109 RepID=A0A9J5WZR4_SOLCO|nr:hypothetical protein H5410_051352 [Solanum commersonii]